jgi:hypothetical protein
MTTREQQVHNISQSVLRHIAAEHPEVSVSDLLSAMFTITRGLIAVILGTTNDEHNRAELVKCVGLLEADIWAKTPKEKIN